tara:strand:+ start:302 stop:490 length:189 start_codon:yes stop_codon:yes gene_type:complete
MKDKIILKDNNGIDVEVDVKTFVVHIQQYHASGMSVHEDRGHYFTVDDKFRKMLNKKINKND